MVAHYNKSKFYMPRDLLKRFDDLYNAMMLDKCKKHDYMKSRRKFKKLVSMVERKSCLLYTSPSPRDLVVSRMPSSA